ncbi:hypothetical protein [Roseovarius sp.]|uniref:hypothetical protein n=1 Tax=Roseovarius sp. TaxID=1486281 RepID=UPI003BADA147
MSKELSDHWSKLEGTVHPVDVPTFESFPDHEFNLDFPPPAFIGDVINAPIVILGNNGGYSSSGTPNEFPDPRAHDEYRDMLANPRPVSPNERTIARYYLERNYSRWLVDGVGVLVNGVAYRSVDGRAKHVARMTRSLPSALYHQDWLRQVLLPQVERGERFVIVHRWSRWNGAAELLRNCRNAVFSTNSISGNLAASQLEAGDSFLSRL